jgi:hypothetical protein
MQLSCFDLHHNASCIVLLVTITAAAAVAAAVAQVQNHLWVRNGDDVINSVKICYAVSAGGGGGSQIPDCMHL